MTTLLYILYGLLGIGILAALIMLVFLHFANKYPVDHDEDQEWADAAAKRARESMRGTL